MPFHSEELLLIFRGIRYQIVRGEKNIDSHIGIVEVLRVEEFTKFFPFLRAAEKW